MDIGKYRLEKEIHVPLQRIGENGGRKKVDNSKHRFATVPFFCIQG